MSRDVVRCRGFHAREFVPANRETGLLFSLALPGALSKFINCTWLHTRRLVVYASVYFRSDLLTRAGYTMTHSWRER